MTENPLEDLQILINEEWQTAYGEVGDGMACMMEVVDKWREKWEPTIKFALYKSKLYDKAVKNSEDMLKVLLKLDSRLLAVKKLVEDYLPQIPMTIDFRRRFYETTEFEVPERFKEWEEEK